MDGSHPNPLRLSPAALPAALFVAGLAAATKLLPIALGLPAVGAALGLALGRRSGRLFAAACLGLLAGSVAPPPELDGFDRERTAEVVGEVVGFWSASIEGPRATLAPVSIGQGERIWLRSPAIGVDLAPGIDPPPPGSRIRVRGELRRAAGYANERPAPPGRLRLRVKSAHFLAIESGPGWLDRAAAALRARVEAPFRSHAVKHPGIAWAAAILFGDLDRIPEREQRAFRRSGLAHLLAVSGMNVALAVAFMALPGAWFDRRARLALFAGAIVAHLLVVGPAPSLARASAMAALAAAALALERAPHPLQALAVASVALLLFSPPLAGEVGFQLSCAATLGIVALTQPIAARLACGPRLLRLAVASSLAAQIATLPLSVAAFSNLSPGGVALNLVYVPLASLLLIAAFAWAALALLLPPAAAMAALALDTVAAPFAWLPWIPAGPWLTLPTEGTLLAGTVAAAFVAALVLLPMRRRVAALAATALLLVGARRPAEDGFELVVADVGQGDGLLLRSGRRAALVDGGGTRGRDLAAQVWLPLFARRGVGVLDAMVVTHGDLDHCGGLVDVAVHVPVREIWSPAQLEGSACLRELRFWSGAPVVPLAAGDRLALGEARVTVLWPERGETAREGNAISLVLRVEAGATSALLTGDLDGVAERRLVARAGETLASDLLKVGHHGSAKGTGAALLAAARPRLAWISAGPGNRFGHPAPEVLARLAGVEARTLRTDLSGEVVLHWPRAGPVRISLPASPRPPA